jgi:hypothetical protein
MKKNKRSVKPVAEGEMDNLQSPQIKKADSEPNCKEQHNFYRSQVP